MLASQPATIGAMEAATQRSQLTGEKAQRIVEAMRAASPGAASPARRSTTSRARPASRAGCCTTTSARRSGCSSRSCAATATCAWRSSTSSSPARRPPRTSSTLLAHVARGDACARTPSSSRWSSSCSRSRAATRRSPPSSPSCMRRTREHVAGLLAAKQAEGVLHLRAEPEAVADVLFSLGDGARACGCSPSPSATSAPTIAGRRRSRSARSSTSAVCHVTRRSRTALPAHGTWLASQPVNATEGDGTEECRQPHAEARRGLLRRRRRCVLRGLGRVARRRAPVRRCKQSDNLTGGGFGVPGSQSEQVDDALDERLPERRPRDRSAPSSSPTRGATAAELRAAVDAVGAAAARHRRRRADRDGCTRRWRALAQRRATGRAAVVVPLAIDVDDVRSIRRRRRPARGARASARTRRRPVGVAPRRPGRAVGRPAGRVQGRPRRPPRARASRSSLLILLAVFGSLAAAALPLALGVVSVLVTGALIYLLSRTMEMSVFVTNMASMIGIGVAVDYSLFVLARYREEIARRPLARARRAAIALATSGVAVAVLRPDRHRLARRACSWSTTTRCARWRSARSSSSRSRCSPPRRCCRC